MIKLNFDKSDGLIPVIIQEYKTLEILMLGFMNKEAFDKTVKNGFVNFWSRSRNIIWKKGEISGNLLKVMELFTDCDSDTLLIKVNLIGKNVCHTGNWSCFYKKLL